MNLEELRSVQDAERRKSGLQPLRESFYAEAGEYIADLKTERERAAERADDPFSSTEVRQLSDEIETAEEVLEAIYERRMGKLLKRASLSAADMSVDEEGLTNEERELFHDLVDRITDNKERVLETLAGESTPDDGVDSPNARPSSADGSSADPTPGDATAGSETGTPRGRESGDRGPPLPDRGTGDDGGDDAPVDAASAMGSGDDGSDSSGTSRDHHEVEPDPAPGGDPAPPDRDRETDSTGTADEPVPGEPRGDGGTARAGDAGGASAGGSPDGVGSEAGTSGGTGGPDADRVTLRITSDVGNIYGVDDREYDLSSEDVVTLPEANAQPLVQRGAAEQLDD